MNAHPHRSLPVVLGGMFLIMAAIQPPDAFSSTLFGMSWTGSEEELRSIEDSGTTALAGPVPGLLTLVPEAAAVDPAAQLVYQVGTTAGGTHLFVMDLVTGTLAGNPLLDRSFSNIRVLGDGSLVGIAWTGTQAELRSIDTSTGQSLPIAGITGMGSMLAAANAVDPSGDMMYQVGFAGAGIGAPVLFLIDTQAGTVADVALDRTFANLRVRADGVLVGLSWNGSEEELRSIDTTTGASSLIGSLTGLVGLVPAAGALNVPGGRLYQVGSMDNQPGSFLFQVDPQTGSVLDNPAVDREFANLLDSAPRNQPPVADAGEDVTAECLSSTSTAVQLDGTGSSDPENDALTYSWAPAGLFNNPDSSQPTGNFPKGVTLVTLTVSDGVSQDTDEVQVTIEDTTAPVPTCPVDITIDDNGDCPGGGVPKGDAQLTAFFAGFSAVDACDATPTLTNDAPACFPYGTTTVTFTACDDDNNCASCTADVTVQDDVPPVINVELNRDALWPPNHKMAWISAQVTVTDASDPNPSFVLTSITSSEPDNGLGDGDTDNDIQEAALGTPDTEFLLRSERAGGGSGRKYTITYTATDVSGNTAVATVCVTVAHDQSGHAMASSGFNATGAGFDTDAVLYRLVVFSRPGLDASQINARSAFVGNVVGVVRPESSRIIDLNGDRKGDLELLYSIPATSQLRSESTNKDKIGLHYRTATGSWLVNNIFGLGPPMAVQNDGSADKNPLTLETPDTDGPDESGGSIVVSDTGRLQFTTRAAGPVRVEVFTVSGRKVCTIVNEDLESGSHDLDWDGTDEGGRPLPAGIYFYRIQMPDRQEVVKIRLAR